MSKAVFGHNRFQEGEIIKISEKQKVNQPSWEQQETDPKLDKLAQELLNNSGIVSLAENQAMGFVEKHGSIANTPKEKFIEVEKEWGYNPVLVKKVFALWIAKIKHREVA